MKIDLTKGITFKQIETIKYFFMTPTEQQIAGNILIAEATGWEFKKNEDNKELYPEGYYSLNDDEDWSRPEDLKFHSDWNWLMNALLYFGVFECYTDIEKTWSDLVEQIKSQRN